MLMLSEKWVPDGWRVARFGRDCLGMWRLSA